jgi:thiol-disulfide isomerase/thioredoxin
MRRLVLSIVLAVAATACGPGPGDGVVAMNQPLPELAGTDLAGRPLSSDDLTGSITVVNAWASWCGPCTRETPVLVNLSKRYAADGVRFLGIDHLDQVAEADRFVDRFSVPYPSFSDQAGRFAAVLGYPTVPATFVVDASGTIRYAMFGEIHEATLVRLLDGLLTPASGAGASAASSPSGA